jgi:hypothetical protein
VHQDRAARVYEREGVCRACGDHAGEYVRRVVELVFLESEPRQVVDLGGAQRDAQAA